MFAKRLKKAGAERRGDRRRPARRRDDVCGEEAARRAGLGPARRAADRPRLRHVEPGRGRVQLDHRRDRDCRRGAAGRHQPALGSAAGQHPRCARRRARARKVFAHRAGGRSRHARSNWLGNDLKLLGKLPKEVAEAFASGRAAGGDRRSGRAGGRRARRGAGAGRAAQAGPGRLERLQRPPHRRVAHGRADPRLCAAGRHRRHRSRGAASWCCCSAPTRSTARRFAGAFKVYIGHHGDAGARAGRPGPAGRRLCREARHLRQPRRPRAARREGGRSRRARRARIGRSSARCRELLGKPLPFDSFDQLRAAMVAEYPAARPRRA